MYHVDLALAYFVGKFSYATVFLLGMGLWYIGAKCTVLFFTMVIPDGLLALVGTRFLWAIPIGISVVEIYFWRRKSPEHQRFYWGVAVFDIFTTVIATMAYLRQHESIDLGSGLIVPLNTAIKVVVAIVAGIAFTFLPELIIRWSWVMGWARIPAAHLPHKRDYILVRDPDDDLVTRLIMDVEDEPDYGEGATFEPQDDDDWDDDPNEPIYPATGYIPPEYDRPRQMPATRYQRKGRG